jgi:hypothetical protein
MMIMRAAFDFIEKPLLYAASRAMAWVYKTAAVSPVRQVVAWEMFVGIIELVLGAAVFYVLFMSGERMFVYALPVMAISKVLDLLLNLKKLKRIPSNYDVRAYRQACTEAEHHRVDRAFLRVLALILVLFAFLLFSSSFRTDYNWVGLTVALYFALYASMFYARAAEPPHPDEGDFFALPQGSGA